MAIKTVSQLEQFDNDASDSGIGKNLTYFKDRYLTTRDNERGRPCRFDEEDPAVYINGATGLSDENLLVQNNDTYWKSLFELSQPVSKSKQNDQSNIDVEYTSHHIMYSELIKNIIWDVKAFLNYRNRLADYDISAIVHGNQYFVGNKTLNGTLSIGDTIWANKLSAHNLTADELTATALSALTADINELNINSKLHINTSTPVQLKDWDFYWGGYAHGLKDDATTFTSCGTWLSVFGTDSSGISLSGKPEREGDPVCFRDDGRPYELTCVNRARLAYTLVNTDGSPLCAGYGLIREVDGLTGAHDMHSIYSAMFIHNGEISATNVIDFAEHAQWSDLGERYLADEQYEPGTLVKFGGEKEITIADTEVNAIVSTKAFDLNACLKDGTVIALCGRVPTKIKGKIEKFDKIMLSEIPGIACKWDGNSRVIGRALESNDDENIKLVECVTRFSL